MPKKKTFEFEALLERFPQKGGYHYFSFPYFVEKEFHTKGHVRVDVLVNGIRMDRALMPLGNGNHHIILGADLRRQAKLKLGDLFPVTLRRKDDQDAVSVPEELSAALDLEPNAWERFNEITPGRQRSICYWIDSAKGLDTRVGRALNMLKRIMSGEFRPKSWGGE